VFAGMRYVLCSCNDGKSSNKSLNLERRQACEAIWDFERVAAVVKVNKGKHLAVMGTYERLEKREDGAVHSGSQAIPGCKISVKLQLCADAPHIV
jgi:hypothetical protein